jgi:hypothetical protein
MATPSHFLPVNIGPRLRERTFVGGSLGVSNSTRELLKEARTVTIMSRNRDVGNLSTTYHLGLEEMMKDEALPALLHAARREFPLPAEMGSAHILMKELESLAVALVRAGTYCRKIFHNSRRGVSPFTFTQYLSSSTPTMLNL